MNAAVVSARQDWAEGYRQFEEAVRRPGRHETLHRQLDLVLEGVRRRVGGAFTLDELAEVYAGSEDWIRAAFEERGDPGWVSSLVMVGDAAFHLTARAALDHVP